MLYDRKNTCDRVCILIPCQADASHNQLQCTTLSITQQAQARKRCDSSTISLYFIAIIDGLIVIICCKCVCMGIFTCSSFDGISLCSSEHLISRAQFEHRCSSFINVIEIAHLATAHLIGLVCFFFHPHFSGAKVKLMYDEMSFLQLFPWIGNDLCDESHCFYFRARAPE